MAKVDVSLAARGDIDDIIAFSVAQFGHEITDRYIAGLDNLFVRPEIYPEIGAPYTDVSPPLRAISYRSHKLYYDIDGGVVTIRPSAASVGGRSGITRGLGQRARTPSQSS